MFKQIAHYSYKTHASLVYTNESSGRIYCVKYNDRSIQWEYWLENQMDQCTEYMIEPLPDGVWGFSPDNEPD